MFQPKNLDKLSQLVILKKVNELKTHIDNLRPFPVDVEGRVLQKLRFDWNYHSNAIEGNSLNYGEFCRICGGNRATFFANLSKSYKWGKY